MKPLGHLDELTPDRRVREGAAFGGILAAICVLIGVGRAALALIGGAGIAALQVHDVVVLGTYALGFVVAGAVVGLLSPVRRTRLGALLLGLLAAAVGIGVFVLGILSGSGPEKRAGLIVAWAVCTVIFGALLARDLYRSRKRAA
jgi:hypothetical protein